MGDVRVGERREHPILPEHALVTATRHLTRGTAERKPRLAAADLEELVRGAAADEAKVQRLTAAGKMIALVHPAAETLRVDEIANPSVFFAAHRFPVV